MQAQGPGDRATNSRVGRIGKIWPRLVLALLSLVVISQLTILGRNTFRDIPRVIANLSQPANWRSARFSQNARFAQYIQFLNQKIPPHYRVVLPPGSVAPRAIATTPVMQFFLLPRQVINCTNPSCLQSLSFQDTAVLVTSDFPGDGLLSQGRLEPFDAGWGVLLSPGGAQESQPPDQSNRRAVELIGNALLATAWLAILAFTGFSIVRRLLPPSWGIARLALGYGLGLALLTLCLALVSSAGIPLRSETVLVVTCLLLAAASASLLIKKRPSQPLSRIDEGERPAARSLRLDLWQIGFILLAILAAFLSIGKGFSATDEIVLWGVKGYGIAADGAIQTVTRWGTNTTTYPLHIPLAIAAASLLLGEALPAAKLLFPAFGLALSLFLYQVLLQLGLHRSLAGLTTLAAITTAHIFRHATLAYANLSLSFYLFAAVALLAQALANGGTRPASGAMLLSGMMFAMAAWTRPEGLALSWLMIGVILLADFFIRGMRVRWENLALLISPLLAYSAFWIWLKSAVYARPLGRADLMEQAAKQILVGHMHFSEAVYVGRTFIASLFQVESGDGLGIFVLIVALTLVLILILRRPRFPGGRIRLSDTPALQAALLMALSGCTYLLAIIGMYYLISYDATHDISWWVNTGLERMLMPGTLLAWAGGVVWLQSLLSRQAEAPLPSPGN